MRRERNRLLPFGRRCDARDRRLTGLGLVASRALGDRSVASLSTQRDRNRVMSPGAREPRVVAGRRARGRVRIKLEGEKIIKKLSFGGKIIKKVKFRGKNYKKLSFGGKNYKKVKCRGKKL